MQQNTCPLCNALSELFYKDCKKSYYICKNCKAIFIPTEALPLLNAEKHRYEEHQNIVSDLGYQKFVSPIVNAVSKDFVKESVGLDFGSGKGSAVSFLLTEKGYTIYQYDPFFKDDRELLTKKYDYIVACEVIEHFHKPEKEFALLKTLLKENGCLYCMTSIYNSTIDFASWYYKDDFTHVFFYQKETIEYIKERFSFRTQEIHKNLIVLAT